MNVEIQRVCVWLLEWSPMLQATGAADQWCVGFPQDSLFISIPLVLVSSYFQVLLEFWVEEHSIGF